MLRPTLLTSAFLALGALTTLRQAATPPEVRHVGTYDTRAIAIAHAASDHNPARKLLRELQAAQAAGDQRKVRELEAWGQKHQEHLHYLGFSHFPVGELLAPVQGEVASLAGSLDLDLIAPFVDYRAPGVERVDITDDLVAIVAPSERTLASIRELGKHAPLLPEEVAHGH
jgi:hypothetical protein